MRAATKQGRNTHTHITRHHLSQFPPGHTHPVFGLHGPPFQAVLQLRAQPARPAELLHHPARVAQLLGGQQRLQGLQVALQGLGERGHRLRRHRGEETRTLPLWKLEGTTFAKSSSKHESSTQKKKTSTSANPSRKCGKMMAGALITSHHQNNILLAESQRPWGSRAAVRQTRRHWTHQGQPCPLPRWNPHNHASFNYKSTPCCMKSSLASTEWKVLHNGVSNVAIPAAALYWPSTRVFIARQIGCYSGNIFEHSNTRLVPPGCQRETSHALTPSARALT